MIFPRYRRESGFARRGTPFSSPIDKHLTEDSLKSIILLLLLLVAGCASHQPPAGIDIAAPKTVTTPSGLKYMDKKLGTGAAPTRGLAATVHYTGTLENGTKFDSSLDRGEPFVFLVGTGTVIRGWDEGIMGMKEGGVRRLIVPPALGYGARRLNNIPPNSTLIFDIELLEVDKMSTLEKLLNF